jgi:hypothetical protein
MLALPTTPAELLAQVVVPALALLPPEMDSPSARVQLVAESIQETGLRSRQQLQGPAHGLLQAEQGGSIRAVLSNPLTRSYAATICAMRGVPATEVDVYAALLTDDILAFVFGRLDLYADPHPLPALGDKQAAWDCYMRVERPGKPRPWDWPNSYSAALAAVQESDT